MLLIFNCLQDSSLDPHKGRVIVHHRKRCGIFSLSVPLSDIANVVLNIAVHNLVSHNYQLLRGSSVGPECGTASYLALETSVREPRWCSG